MTHWKPLAFETMHKKARLLQHIRAFFLQQNIMEVATPLLSTSGTTDPSIESLTLNKKEQVNYLQTSPEFFMKRMLAAGSGSIYQIAHAFRDEEQEGRHHLTEFSLIEWYVVNWDYMQLMLQIEELIVNLLPKKITFKTYTYEGLFVETLGFNPITISTQKLSSKVDDNLKSLSRDGLLDYFMSIEILPQLSSSGWFFVKDYPASQASLAKISDTNPQVAERFELFYNGLELANGFSELQNAAEQLQRFEQDNLSRRQNNQNQIPIDRHLISAIEDGLPTCAGVAIGLERLMMAIYGVDDINHVGLN